MTQKLTPLAKKVLDSRVPKDKQDEFLNISGKYLPHFSWLKNFDTKVFNWLEKVNKEDTILIFGDYDVDGLFSSSLAHIILDTLGYKTEIFIPCRFNDGYGFSIQTLVRNNLIHYKNILVLDSGTSESLKAEAFPANILIIDHHTPSNDTSDDILINPHTDSEISQDFCTGSLIYLFNQALAQRHPILHTLTPLCLVFSSITTISDQCILTPHNRALVAIGLNLISAKTNNGLAVLISCLFDDKVINETDLGWKICPTINAAGRLGKPQLVIDLLCNCHTDSEKAFHLTNQLIELNDQRKELTNQAVEEAIEQASNVEGKILCVFNHSWHPGIVGIVAGNVSTRFKKPCFAFTKGASGLWEGSGRSYSNISLLECTHLVKEQTVTYGGHAQAMGIKTQNVPQLQYALNKLTKLPTIDKQESSLPITINSSDANPANIIGLDVLRPFGNGNDEPLFLIKGNITKVSAAKTGMTGVIQDNYGTLRFYCPEEFSKLLKEKILNSTSIELIGSLDYTPPFTPSLFIRELI